MRTNRRRFPAVGAAAPLALAQAPNSIRNLRPMTTRIHPITADERQTRFEKANL